MMFFHLFHLFNIEFCQKDKLRIARKAKRETFASGEVSFLVLIMKTIIVAESVLSLRNNFKTDNKKVKQILSSDIKKVCGSAPFRTQPRSKPWIFRSARPAESTRSRANANFLRRRGFFFLSRKNVSLLQRIPTV